MSRRIMPVPYFQVPVEIFDVALTEHEKMVYVYLCRCGNQGAEAYPSYRKIAEECSISKATAKRAIKGLQENGLITIRHRPKVNGDHQSNSYQITIPIPKVTGNSGGGVSGDLGSGKPHPVGAEGPHPGVRETPNIEPFIKNPTFIEEPQKAVFSLDKNLPSNPASKETQERNKSVTYQLIVDLYHTHCPDMERVQLIDVSIKRKIDVLCKELQNLDAWAKYFSFAGRSNFLSGRIKDFRANLSWLLSKGNMRKVLDGRYENRQVQHQARDPLLAAIERAASQDAAEEKKGESIYA